MGLTRAQKINKIFNRDGIVQIDYKDGSCAMIDDLCYKTVEEVVEEMLNRGDIKEEEKDYYLEHGRVVNCCLYDKGDYSPYDEQEDILVTDDVTDALFCATYSLDYAVRVIPAHNVTIINFRDDWTTVQEKTYA